MNLPEGFVWLDNQEENFEPDYDGYEEGVATTFGYEDPEDNGIGAWGDRTNSPDIVGVALPRRVLRDAFGDEDAAHQQLVEVVNPETGKVIRAPIVDKGPADWVIDRQGPTIDLTEGARVALGAGGKTPVRWRILGEKGSDPEDFAQNATSPGPGPLPAGFVWLNESQDSQTPPRGQEPAIAAQGEPDPPSGFIWAEEVAGIKPGNIDLFNRPLVKNPDGSVSTVRSISIEEDGQTILIPTVIGGKIVGDKEAIDHYHKTGEHLGIFRDQMSADYAAQNIHKDQERQVEKISFQKPGVTSAPNIFDEPGVTEKEPTGTPGPVQDFAARIARGAESAVGGIKAGAYDMTAAGLKGERNPYLEATREQAIADIPALEAQQRAEEIKNSDPNYRPSMDDIERMGQISKRLQFAKDAAKGITTEGFQASLSRSSEQLSKETIDKTKAARDKWQPLIDKARDSEWGSKLAESIGNSLPSTAAAVANPIFGISAMWAQQYNDSRQEYINKKSKDGLRANSDEADLYAYQQAMAQTPWEIVGDVASARGLRKVFEMLPRSAVKSGAQSYGRMIVNTIKALAPGILGETFITTPAQSLAQDIIAEKNAIQEPTSVKKKLEKIPEQMGLAAAQSAIMFGVPASVAGVASKAIGKTQPKLPDQTTGKPSEIKSFEDIPHGIGKEEIVTGTTDQPTSDEELEAMKKAYEQSGEYKKQQGDIATLKQEGPRESEAEATGPDIMRILSKSGTLTRGRNISRQERQKIASKSTQAYKEIFAEGQDKFYENFIPILRRYKQEFSKLNVPVYIKHKIKSSAAIGFDANGNIWAIVNPMENMISNRVIGPQAQDAILGEESIHAAHLIGLKNEWESKGRPGTYTNYVRKSFDSIIDDIRNTSDGATPKESKYIRQAISDSYNLYETPYDESALPSNADDFFDVIKSNKHDIQFLSEFLRQAKQQEKQGAISEDTFQSLWDKVSSWVKKSLKRIYSALPGAREGRFGKAVKRELDRIEHELEVGAVNLIKVKKPPSPIISSIAERFGIGLKKSPVNPSAIVNIGLNTNDGKGITQEEAIRAISDLGIGVTSQEVRESNTEPTLIASLDRPLTPEEADAVSRKLRQEAIAQKVGEEGELYGPLADNWRPFNNDYFLEPSGKLGAKRGGFMLQSKKLRSAAVMSPDGVVYEAKTHAAAFKKAGIDLGDPRGASKAPDFNYGFVTQGGKFVNREEAFRIAIESKQTTYENASSEHIKFASRNQLGAKKSPEPVRTKEELEKLAKDYEKYKTWYEDFDEFLNSNLGDNKEYKPLLTEFIASTSPMESISGNIKKAFSNLKTFIETGSLSSSFPTHAVNLKKAIEGIRLGGPKVGQFSEAMAGNKNAVAVDRFVSSVLFETKKPTHAQVKLGQKVSAEIAKALGWDSRQVQAAWWAAGKELYGDPRARGNKVDTYEQYLEQYKEELDELFTKDRSGEKRGINASRRISERISKETSSKAVDEQILAAKKLPKSGATARPVVNRAISPIVARTTSLSGKRSWRFLNVPPFDFTRFYNGTADVFEKTPGLEYLGKAIRQHVDLRRKYSGKYGAPFRAWEKKTKNSGKALKEFENYWETHERSGIHAASSIKLSPEAQELVDLTKSTLNELGEINQKNNVHVWDGKIQKFRPIGKIGKEYFPRILKAEVMDILRNPASNPEAWEELKDEMIADGLIPATNSEKAMLAYVDNVLQSYRTNDYFGALDMARAIKLPNKVYDYSFDVIRRYIMSWSERMSQIESFGQKLGSQGKDLFDKAQLEAGDAYTKSYIKQVQDRAYNGTLEDGYARILAATNEVATGLQLANPVSTSKNWISGMTFNAQHFGVGRFLKSILDVKNTFKEIDDAYERGILMDDLMNIMQDGGQMERERLTSKFASGALKLAGFNAAETWVRGVNIVASRAMLRDAIRAYGKNPRSNASRRYLGHFKRLNINGQDLILENGKGELTDKYLRAAVNELQGGYTYDQVPAFMDSPVGRFLFKYQKWGSQQLRHFDREVIRPAIRAMSGGTLAKETVKITDPKTGQTETLSVPGAILPLVRYMVLLTAAGAGTEWFLEQFFNIPPRTASLAQIISRASRDKDGALGLLANKIWAYQLMAGSMGLLGNYAQIGKDFTERTRYKNPTDPPGLDPLKKGLGLAMDFFEQGGKVTPRNFDDFLSQTLSAYRTSKQFLGRAQDVFGTNFRALQVTSRRQDFGWIRGLTGRYNEEIGARTRRTSLGRVSKTENSPFRDAFFEDLIVGDTKTAARRMKDHLSGMSEERAKIELASLKASVRARQPIRAGSGGGEAMRVNFLQWAQRNLGPSEIAKVRRIDQTYRRTAVALGLMSGEEPDEENLQKAMRRIQLLSR